MRSAGITLLLVALAAFCGAPMVHADTILEMLGSSAGFADGSTNARVGTWDTATAGNSAPFNGYIGGDATQNFAASWTFSFAPPSAPFTFADLRFGIYDIDSAASGNQVSTFTVGGVDLTAQLNALSEGLHGGTGAVNNEYDIFNVALPSSVFADIHAGSVPVTLDLVGPGLGVLGATTFNGAGVDFSSLSVGVPEPSTWLLLLAGAGILGRSRRFRRR